MERIERPMWFTQLLASSAKQIVQVSTPYGQQLTCPASRSRIMKLV